MTKLHELLAVETSLENQANKVRTDLANTFEKKRHLFEEKRTVFYPLGEHEKPVTETQSDIQSTVAKELAWVQPFLTKALDASFQVADANTRAVADIVLDDEKETVLATNVPATALLELEKRCAEIHAFALAIPTLDPAKGFRPDEQRGAGFFQAREVNKNRTKKDVKVIVKYEATKEHPAQTELMPVDVVTGKIQEQEWSGLMTPSEKAEVISRVEMLSRAVRRARSRANEIEVNTRLKIGAPLLKFVFGN
jgi:hypothetical protein